MTAIFHTFPDAAAAAQALAERVADDLRTRLATQERATLAVSGGRSPIAFFNALNQIDLAWERINISLVDERIVPFNHADSNSALVRRHLLQNRAAAARWLPVVDEQADAAALGDTAAALAFALQHHQAPDVVVLGMGSDGHTASLFPEAPQLADGLNPDYPHALLHTSPQTAPHERLSMTLAAIENAPHIYLAIGGSEKHDVYRQAAAERSTQYPISFIIHSQKADCHVIYHP